MAVTVFWSVCRPDNSSAANSFGFLPYVGSASMLRTPPRQRRYPANSNGRRANKDNSTLQRLALYGSDSNRRWAQRYNLARQQDVRRTWFYCFASVIVAATIITTMGRLQTRAFEEPSGLQDHHGKVMTIADPLPPIGRNYPTSQPWVLTAHVEKSMNGRPLPNRTRQVPRTIQYDAPVVGTCASMRPPYEILPIDSFPDDAFLPWIHDYVTTPDATRVRFLAQNKRRCETGEGKEMLMQFWEPQIALFQGVAVETHGEKIQLTSNLTAATARDTRFICHFHSGDDKEVSFSEFDFNYEYVLWRKGKLPMFKKKGPDVSTFETSQLLFSCPIPERFQPMLRSSLFPIYLDIVPIRTPARELPWLTTDQTGPRARLWNFFNAETNYSEADVLPKIEDSGRWANLPVCAAAPQPSRHRLVACTWTSASYNRRGDATQIGDSAQRLREWIIFHKLVGVDHIYIYDNTQGLETSPLQAIAESFPYVTYHRWKATVCSNNRPNFKNPGERSSQYAADASCRVRYGDHTEWMTFIDTDEYLVPANHSSWHDVLDDVGRHYDVLKMRSSRGRPRIRYMEEMADQSTCKKQNRRKMKLETQPCFGRKANETFLRLYNCDYIRHPRPDRFARAMKQIYRPSQVLSHFVHYSTVTKGIARYFHEFKKTSQFQKTLSSSDYRDVFLDELTQGSLLHAKTVLPHETMTWVASCKNASRHTCAVGLECPESTDFVDVLHQKNVFHDESGRFCNCWVDRHLEDIWIPRLEKSLADFPLLLD